MKMGVIQSLFINIANQSYSPMLQSQHLQATRNQKVRLCLVLPASLTPKSPMTGDNTLRHRHSTLKFEGRGGLPRSLLLNWSLRLSQSLFKYGDSCRLPTISKVCKLYPDLGLSPNVVDHPRSHIDIHSFYELSVRPMCMILSVNASEEG